MLVSEHNVHAWPNSGSAQLPRRGVCGYGFIALGLIGQAKMKFVCTEGADALPLGARLILEIRVGSSFQVRAVMRSGRRLGRRRLGRRRLVGRDVDRAEARCAHPRLDRPRKSAIAIWLRQAYGP